MCNIHRGRSHILWTGMPKISIHVLYVWHKWPCTLSDLLPTLNNLAMWSRPMVERGPAFSVKLLSRKRRNIELLPAPYSPHRITLYDGIPVAMVMPIAHYSIWWQTENKFPYNIKEKCETNLESTRRGRTITPFGLTYHFPDLHQ